MFSLGTANKHSQNSLSEKLNYECLLQLHVQVSKAVHITGSVYTLVKIHRVKRKICTFTVTEMCRSENCSYQRLLSQLIFI